MTQAGHETNTGNSQATAASGVMAHQYELLIALKAEADKLNVRYDAAYNAINDALPLHPACRANSRVGEAYYWEEFERTEQWRLNPMNPAYETTKESIRRRYEEREQARKAPELLELIERLDEADEKWLDLEHQMLKAPIYTVGDARIKITLLKQCMDENKPRGQEFPLLDLCEQLIALRTGQ